MNGRRSSLQHMAGMESVECHVAHLSKVSMQPISRSNLMIVSRQPPLRRSARLLQSEKLKSENSSQLTTPSKKSVKSHPGSCSHSRSKQKGKLTPQGIRVRNQLKLPGVLEEAQNGCRRSSRLASKTSPQQFPHRNSRRRSIKLVVLDPVYECVQEGAKNPKTSEAEAIIKSFPKKRLKNDCESMGSQLRRSSRRLTAASSEVMKRGVTLNVADKVEEVEEKLNADRGGIVLDRRLGDGFLTRKTAELGKQKRRKMEQGIGAHNRIEKIKKDKRHVTVGWTNGQEEALHKAYLKAKPSPHFWKKVSRMVPGKSAQDCFDKIHASIITPLSSQPRSKTRVHGFSPVANFSLSDMISSETTKLEAGRLGKTRNKKLAAHKTIRHFLRKHSIIDRSKAFDRFSLLESSLINISSPAALRSLETSSLPQQSDMKSSSNSKMLSRFKQLNSLTAPSPEVLKQIKNRALHDRYIDQLHHRDARRAILAKKSKAGSVGGKPDHGVLKAARIALISDAVSFVKQFRNSPGNTVQEFEEGEGDDCYGDDEDGYGDDVDK